jgi:hypothetical protein
MWMWEVEMKKKAKSFILAAALTFATGLFAASPVFADPIDTAGHWAEGQILAGINYGYIKGYPDNTFKPDDTITRAEFVALINRAQNYTAMTNIPFSDVVYGEWYFEDVQRAYSARYIQGDNEGRFNPNARITRQEVAVILNRIAPGGDTSYALYGVRDADKIDDWALLAVRAAYSKGYIMGDSEGYFNPLNPLKRGEAVTIVNRVLGIGPMTPGAAFSISNINVSNVNANDATLNLTVTRNGTVHWVVLTGADATIPTANQVLNGRTHDNLSAYGSGNRTVYANSAITATLSSLQSEQSYKICAVAQDASANLSTVVTYTFTTANAGENGEEWLNSNFTVNNIANNSITLTVNSSRTGTLYYVVVEDPNRNVKTPPQNHIKNGRDASNGSTNVISGNLSVSSGSPRSVDITGLKGGTNYKIFGCVYENSSASSLYSKVKSSVFTTTGTNVDWIALFETPSSEIGATVATLNVRTNRTGTLYYVVTTDSRQPTAAQIKNGRDYGNTYVMNNSVPAGSTSTLPSIVLSSLTANTNYYVYGVLYINNSEYSEIETRSFKTGVTLSVSYKLSATTTTGAISGTIAFTASGNYAYNANSTITANGADLTITVGNAGGAAVRTTLQNNKLDTTSTSVSIKNTLLDATNTLTLTVSESGKGNLYYYITVNN